MKFSAENITNVGKYQEQITQKSLLCCLRLVLAYLEAHLYTSYSGNNPGGDHCAVWG